MIYQTTCFDEQLFQETYHRHHADVTNYFRGRNEDLLVVNLCEGQRWEPLCDFLDMEIPDVDFPRSNMLKNNYDSIFS